MTPYEVDIEEVEYVRHGDTPFLARVFKPRGAGPFPAVVEAHGGAWCLGARTNNDPINTPIARGGVVAGTTRFGLAWADLAGGRFIVCEVDGQDALEAELARLEPAELLLPDEDGWAPAIRERIGARRRAPWLFDADSGRRQLLQFFHLHDLSAFGIDDKPLCIAAAGALLGYVEETQKQQLPHLTAIAFESVDGAIAMNAATRRHLVRGGQAPA
jgi:DNA mismatch repair ATPase MutS